MSPVNVTLSLVSMRTLFRSCLKERSPSLPFPELEGGAKNEPPPPAFPPNMAQKREFHCNDPEIRSLWLSLCFDHRQSKSDKKGKKICGVGFRNFFATFFTTLFLHLGQKKTKTLPKQEEKAKLFTVSTCNCLLTFIFNKMWQKESCKN